MMSSNTNSILESYVAFWGKGVYKLEERPQGTAYAETIGVDELFLDENVSSWESYKKSGLLLKQLGKAVLSKLTIVEVLPFSAVKVFLPTPPLLNSIETREIGVSASPTQNNYYLSLFNKHLDLFKFEVNLKNIMFYNLVIMPQDVVNGRTNEEKNALMVPSNQLVLQNQKKPEEELQVLTDSKCDNQKRAQIIHALGKLVRIDKSQVLVGENFAKAVSEAESCQFNDNRIKRTILKPMQDELPDGMKFGGAWLLNASYNYCYNDLKSSSMALKCGDLNNLIAAYDTKISTFTEQCKQQYGNSDAYFSRQDHQYHCTHDNKKVEDKKQQQKGDGKRDDSNDKQNNQEKTNDQGNHKKEFGDIFKNPFKQHAKSNESSDSKIFTNNNIKFESPEHAKTSGNSDGFDHHNFWESSSTSYLGDGGSGELVAGAGILGAILLFALF
ncbi:hypothetical protein MIDIC_110058 [Alphaproteobacteria bacterium]